MSSAPTFTKSEGVLIINKINEFLKNMLEMGYLDYHFQSEIIDELNKYFNTNNVADVTSINSLLILSGSPYYIYQEELSEYDDIYWKVYEKDNFIQHLIDNTGKALNEKCQNELVEVSELGTLGAIGFHTLNGYLLDSNLPFIIKQFVDEKNEGTYWKIYKLVL